MTESYQLYIKEAKNKYVYEASKSKDLIITPGKWIGLSFVDLQDTVSGLNTTVSGLNNSVSGLNSEIKTLQTTVVSINTSVNNITTLWNNKYTDSPIGDNTVLIPNNWFH